MTNVPSSGFGLHPALFASAVICLGLSAFLTQLVLMRELVGVLSGNELVYGIVLGSWMLLTGVGSSLGRIAGRSGTFSAPSAPLVLLVAAEMLVALLPIADVFLLRWLRNVVFLRGAELGVADSVVTCLALLAPYCLVMGYALTVACQVGKAVFISPQREPTERMLARTRWPGWLGSILHRRARASTHPTENGQGRARASTHPTENGPAAIGMVYLLDNLGNVLGGVAFVLVLAWFCNHFIMLYFAAATNLLLATFVAAKAGSRSLAAASAILLALLLGATYGDLDGVSRRREYAGQDVVFQGTSAYGSLVVTESAGQVNFIENGVPLFSSHNIEQVEETVHYAMAQRPNAQRVLLVSGGASGTARETLKYPVKRVDYVELDPLLLETAARFLPNALADPRIHVINSDGRRFVGQTAKLPHDGRYDVVIVDVPEPSSAQLNRYYTREFFAEVHRALAPDGVVSLSIGGYEDYLSTELARLVDIMHRTLGRAFRRVLMLPGGRVYFIASDGELTTDVAAALRAGKIGTRFVNANYLKGMFTPDRMADLRRALADDGPVNEDFNPILYYRHLRYWMRQYQNPFGFLEAGLLAVLVLYMIRLRPVSLIVFSGGMTATVLEVVLLLAFQVLFGSLYYQVGVIVTVFMFGLVLGALLIARVRPGSGISGEDRRDLWRRRRRLPSRGLTPRSGLALLAVALALVAAGVPFGLMSLGKSETALALAVAAVAIPLLTLLVATLVGMQFPLAARIDYRDPASTSARYYTADYLGAALGALLASTWLIPVLGVTTVCLLVAGLNLLAGIVTLGARAGPP